MDYKKTQLNMKDFIGEYPVVRGIDRDCEVPNLVKYIKKHSPVKTLLDVGSASSHLSYAKKIRKYIKVYNGVDIVPCRKTKEIIDAYHVGNAVNFYPVRKKYDIVTCVSVIEHAGLSTYDAFFRKERYQLFERLLDLAKKHIWISFPVGLEYIACNDKGYPDSCAINRHDLEYFEALAKSKGWKFKERFFYTQGAQAYYPWREHTDRDLALKVPYMDFIGNQSICIMELSKKGGS